MKLTNTNYDIMKFIVNKGLPGLGTLYFALAAIWGFPYGEQVVGTITAFTLFLSLLLGQSTAAYKKSDEYGDGSINISEGEGLVDNWRVDWTTPLMDIEGKEFVTLKVKNNKENV